MISKCNFLHFHLNQLLNHHLHVLNLFFDFLFSQLHHFLKYFILYHLLFLLFFFWYIFFYLICLLFYLLYNVGLGKSFFKGVFFFFLHIYYKIHFLFFTGLLLLLLFVSSINFFSSVGFSIDFLIYNFSLVFFRL